MLALGQYGVELNTLQDQVATAMGGQGAGFFYEGDRRAEIVVRLPEDRRSDIDQLGSLPIQVSNGGYVPLKELVDIELTTGLNQVNRENGKRRVVVTANVRGRDLGSFVSDVQETIESEVSLPAGYWVEYGGTYQTLQSRFAATGRGCACDATHDYWPFIVSTWLAKRRNDYIQRCATRTYRWNLSAGV